MIGVQNHLKEGLREGLICKEGCSHPERDLKLEGGDAELTSLFGHGPQVSTPVAVKNRAWLAGSRVIFVIRERLQYSVESLS